MGKNLRHAFRLAAVGGLLAGAVTIPASAAQATPSNCSGRYDLNTYSAFCGKGTGSFRAKARCYKIGGSSYVTRYGAWKKAGSTLSTAVCLNSEEVASGSWDLKNS